MAELPAAAAYKKKSGQIVALDNEKTIAWQETGSSAVGLKFPASTVLTIKASLATSPKNLLQVVCSGSGPGEEIKHQFSFATREALETAKLALQNLLQRRQPAPETQASSGTPGPASGPTTADSMSAASPVPPSSGNGISTVGPGIDEKSLLQNHELQQRLLRENKELMRIFQEAVIVGSLPAVDFWSTRIHDLRAAALQTYQRNGPYNVLSTIKPKTTNDNQINVSLTREKIRDIFDQYPIVRQAYNECVPKLSEADFWGRFFTSRLFRRLRGERITANDRTDSVLDRYLSQFEQAGAKRKADNDDEFVPQFRDMEGNEQDDPQKLGNRPDITMQPGKTGTDYMSLIHTMNRLSQQMVHAAESNEKGPQQNELELESELRLADLADKSTENPHVELKIRSGVVSNHSRTVDPSVQYNEDEIRRELGAMKSDLAPTMDLSFVATEDNVPEISAAFKHFTDLARIRGEEALAAADSTGANWIGTAKTLDLVQITHATSIEFLRHFWSHFLSGDPAQVGVLSKLVASLQKSIERIDSVVSGAPGSDREKIRVALAPLVDSIREALRRYEEALQLQASESNNAIMS